jgi:DNA-binding Xre family transcriptional regulator
MTAAQFPQILKVLKSALKNNGWTYRDLGARLKIPESTIKKMFIAKDWSFSRLQQVCEALNLDLADLLEAIREQEVMDIEFSEKQESLFKQEPRAFQLYWHLVYERQSAEQFQKKNGLERRDLFRLLRLLDTHGLIELHAGDEVRVPTVRPVRWSKRSEFVRATKLGWAAQAVQDAARRDAENCELVVQYFQLSVKSAADLMSRLADLEQEFASRTARDMTLSEGELVRTRVVLAVAEGSFVK